MEYLRMRTEQAMLDLILRVAREDPRVRAVIANGSRVNPNAPKDRFQDFDIVYVVTDVASFTASHSLPGRFGELMIMQMPEAMGEPPPRGGGRFGYLMQFTDGNRIDLTLFPVARIAELETDSLSVLLLDKDGLVAPFPPPSDTGYLPKPPTAKQFADCCNEFWWVSPYVAKGLWREELTYAMSMLDPVLREQLMKMLAWYAGARTGFARCIGKSGKYLNRYLEPELWQMLVRTYPRACTEEIWSALFTMGDLFRRVATDIARRAGFDYPHGDDERVTAHLKHVRTLPKDAKEIY